MAKVLPLFQGKDISCTEVTDKELGRISMHKNPNDALAVVKMPDDTATDQPVADKIINMASNELVLVLDDMRDPGNMGTIIRAADWFGIRQILCSPDSVEVYNPKVIQSTMGAFIRVNVNYHPLADILKADNAIPVVGAVMDGDSLYSAELPGNGFIVIGSESHGISPEVESLLTKKISIPSPGSGTESLNASVATSIILAEYYRQNSFQTGT